MTVGHVTEVRFVFPGDGNTDSGVVVARAPMPEHLKARADDDMHGGVNICDEAGAGLWVPWAMVRGLIAALTDAATWRDTLPPPPAEDAP